MPWFRYIVGRGLAPAVLFAFYVQTDRRGRRSLQVRRGVKMAHQNGAPFLFLFYKIFIEKTRDIKRYKEKKRDLSAKY